MISMVVRGDGDIEASHVRLVASVVVLTMRVSIEGGGGRALKSRSIISAQ